jgi:hypothetical protein
MDEEVAEEFLHLAGVEAAQGLLAGVGVESSEEVDT